MPAWPESVTTLKGDIMRDMHRVVSTRPSDPVAITGVTDKMLGLAITYTPVRTGRLMVIVTANITSSASQTSTVRMRYGTGTAPANDAAATGNAAVQQRIFTAGTSPTSVPFHDSALIDGNATGQTTLLIGTPYWIDYSAVSSDAGSTSGLTDVSMVIFEI